MNIYLLKTDLEYWHNYGDGEFGMSFLSEKLPVYLFHDQKFTKKEFEEHIQQSITHSIKEAPNRIKATLELEKPLITFDQVVENMLKMFDYQHVVPLRESTIKKEVIYDEKQQEEVAIIQIKGKEEKAKEEAEDDFLDMFFQS